MNINAFGGIVIGGASGPMHTQSAHVVPAPTPGPGIPGHRFVDHSAPKVEAKPAAAPVIFGAADGVLNTHACGRSIPTGRG